MITRDRPPFIVFEGLDGSGKTNHMALLARRLRSMGHRVHTTAEPTTGPVGATIRNIMSGRLHAGDVTIAALFVADRLDHLTNATDGILQKLAAGFTVVCDRYYFSSYAYHSAHVAMDWVIQANSLAADLLRPDLTIFLDTPPEECFARIARNGRDLERYEEPDHLAKVRANYFQAFERLAAEEAVAIVDSSGRKDVTEKLVLEALVARGILSAETVRAIGHVA